jgi:hypothetical protein
MSIVLPLKKESSQSKSEVDFASWKTENLVQFAKQANERIKAQQEQIEALKMDMKCAMEAYRKILIETQHSLSDP